MERIISKYHPVISFAFFVVVIGGTMMFNHPVFIAISLLCSLIFSFILDKKRCINLIFFSLGMISFIAIINAIFVNRGTNKIFYIGLRMITYESLFYGIISGMMLSAVMIWFYCYNEVFSSDKFLYIFGKISPTISLMIDMTLRLIPKLLLQVKVIESSQCVSGFDNKSGNILNKIKNSMRIISSLLTWSLEDAVDTADSMKARGYGLKGRTSFSIYRFVGRDMIMMWIIGLGGMIILAGFLNGYCTYNFYPVITPIDTSMLSISLYITFFLICLIPSLLEIMEDLRWKYLK